MVVSFEVFKILFWPLSSGFAQPSACFPGKALVRKQCRGCRDWKHIGNALFLLLIKKWLQQFSKSCCYQDFSLDFWRSPGLASISDSGSFTHSKVEVEKSRARPNRNPRKWTTSKRMVAQMLIRWTRRHRTRGRAYRRRHPTSFSWYRSRMLTRLVVARGGGISRNNFSPVFLSDSRAVLCYPAKPTVRDPNSYRKHTTSQKCFISK